MRVHIPDYAPIELGETKTVEETRRILVDQGYTTVAGARGRQEANGDIHFERNVGGEKAA
jgi:hypothetical protein